MPIKNAAAPVGTGSTPPLSSASDAAPGGGGSYFSRASFRTSKKPPSSPPPDAATDPALQGKIPKRTGSFRSLGGLASMALTNGVSHIGRKAGSGASTPPSPLPGLALPGKGLATNPAGPPGGPDSSHLAQFSLRLTELVNKVFAPCAPGQAPAAAGIGKAAEAAKNVAGGGPVIPPLATISYEGRRLPEKVKVVEFAQTVVNELEYACSVDAYLLRAVSRAALKALTLFATRIDSLLVSPSRDSGALRIPTNAKEGSHLPAAMEFNVGLVTLAWIVEDALEDCIEGTGDSADFAGVAMPSFVSEILTPVRQNLERIILHVIQPLLTATKTSLTSCLLQAVPVPFTSGGVLSQTSSNSEGSNHMMSLGGAAAAAASASPFSKADVLSSALWVRELENRLDGARKLLVPRIEQRCGRDGEGWFISVVIHLIWKGLLILSARPAESISAYAQPASAVALHHALESTANSKRSASPVPLAAAFRGRPKRSESTGHSQPNSGRSTPMLPAERDGATVRPSRSTLQQLHDLQAFEKLVARFAKGFLPDTASLRSRAGNPFGSNGKQAPVQTQQEAMYEGEEESSDSDSDSEDELARAALAEAMQAIRSTIVVLQHLDSTPEVILRALCRSRRADAESGGSATSCATSSPVPSVSIEVLRSFKSIPPLLLLHTVYCRVPATSSFANGLELLPPPALFALSWVEYERSIAGFAAGEQWAAALAQGWADQVRLQEEGEKAATDGATEGTSDSSAKAPTSAESSDTSPHLTASPRTEPRTSTSSDRSVPMLDHEGAMTQSLPMLDEARDERGRTLTGETFKGATGSGAVSARTSPASSLERRASRPARAARASEGASPSLTAVASSVAGADQPVVPVGVVPARTPRFWRSTSSQQGMGKGFHLPSLPGRSSRNASSVRGSALPSPAIGAGGELGLPLDTDSSQPLSSPPAADPALEALLAEKRARDVMRLTLKAVMAQVGHRV